MAHSTIARKRTEEEQVIFDIDFLTFAPMNVRKWNPYNSRQKFCSFPPELREKKKMLVMPNSRERNAVFSKSGEPVAQLRSGADGANTSIDSRLKTCG